jgi:hypothetical protein
MASSRLPLGLFLLALGACTTPASLSDGLDAPPNPPTALPDVMFPNAPVGSGWLTVGALRWQAPVPLRRDPVYEPSNESGLVDYGDDDPNATWERQTSVVTDAGLPTGAQQALEFRMPRGLTGGYAASKVGQHPDNDGDGPLLWDPALNTGHLYVGFYVRFSPAYDLNGNVGQKVFYLKSDLPENRSIAHMVGIMMNDGNGGDQLWPTYGPQSPFGRYQLPATAANDLNDGRWHLVEYLQGPNTPGLDDGTLQVWLDGRLAYTWTNARFFAAGQTPSLNRLEINPIYGGGNNPVVVDQWLRVGPVMIRTR